MCGIAGLFAAPAEAGVDVERLTAIRDRMRSRGPDDCGLTTVAEGRIGLAHRRLSILDLSPAGHQPMADEAHRLSIVYNGEIYNFRELKAELEAAGEHFRSGTDTEVILTLYRREGIAMLPRLRGMFAFALWDGGQQRLLLARDIYGIKPLYYRTGPSFAFASQLRALLSDPATPRTLDPAGVTGFALWGAVPEPFTIARAVSALPAGCYLEVDRRGRAGSPKVYASVASILSAHAGDTPRPLGPALADSVAAHMIADVEVGCFLSAGVDSGAILGLMRDAGASRVRAITLRFEEFAGTADDEAPLAAEIARLYGASHIVETVTAADFDAARPQILAAMDQPSVDGVNSWFVSRAAAHAGLKVALSGLGGDELLAGYSTFRTVPRTVRRLGLLARLPGVPALGGAVAGRLWPENRKAAHVLRHAGSLAEAYLLHRAMLLPETLGALLPPEIVREGLARLAPVDTLRESLSGLPDEPVLRIAALESSNYMKNQLLRDSDWAGMAHSLEIRVPLVDPVLLAAVAPHLPALGGGRGKQILANAPSRPLPDAIVNRPKTGFGTPVARWSSGAGARRLADGWAELVLSDYCAATGLSA